MIAIVQLQFLAAKHLIETGMVFEKVQDEQKQGEILW
ncbi:hypothetical protein NIES4073_67980 [Kalymmatonema gypsitolerans NIES-4073]|nr:hypothetical protein NIES4073_67980 [Scytonema sp. NIES-4073]